MLKFFSLRESMLALVLPPLARVLQRSSAKGRATSPGTLCRRLYNTVGASVLLLPIAFQLISSTWKMQ